MKVIQTPFAGLLILEPPVFQDDRGYFSEAYSYQKLRNQGIDIQFVQDNQSFSRRGVIRGLHFQNAPKPQTKLVRVLHGLILDIVVDLRKDHPTFRKVHAIQLSGENKKQLIVPKGFAHGFSVLSETAEVLYKCDEGYAPECEAGIRFDDAELNIDWMIEHGKRIVSSKDSALPFLNEARFHF